MRRTFGLLLFAAMVQGLAAAPAWAQQHGAAVERDAQDFQNVLRTKAPTDELGKAVSAIREKRYDAAIRSLDAFTEWAPQNPAGWRLLGAAYAGKTKWTASRRAYERALRLAPDDAVSHAGRGEALLALKDPKAQDEAAWLTARTEACGGSCPEADVLKTLATRGPFAAPPAG